MPPQHWSTVRDKSSKSITHYQIGYVFSICQWFLIVKGFISAELWKSQDINMAEQDKRKEPYSESLSLAPPPRPCKFVWLQILGPGREIGIPFP